MSPSSTLHCVQPILISCQWVYSSHIYKSILLSSEMYIVVFYLPSNSLRQWLIYFIIRFQGYAFILGFTACHLRESRIGEYVLNVRFESMPNTLFKSCMNPNIHLWLLIYDLIYFISYVPIYVRMNWTKMIIICHWLTHKAFHASQVHRVQY